MVSEIVDRADCDSVTELFATRYPEGTRDILQYAFLLGEEALRYLAVDGGFPTTYLANPQYQRAMERVLTLFCQALNDLPDDLAERIDPRSTRCRDLVAQSYRKQPDHAVIWCFVNHDLPERISIIQDCLDGEID